VPRVARTAGLPAEGGRRIRKISPMIGLGRRIEHVKMGILPVQEN
jgi:hypothetical protein